MEEPKMVKSQSEEDEEFVQKRDTRQDYYSKTSAAKFVAETTQSLMGSSEGAQFGPKRESSFELSEISSRALNEEIKDEN